MSFGGVVLEDFVFSFLFFFGGYVELVDFCQLCSEVWQDEHIWVLSGFGDEVNAFVGEFYGVVFFVYDEVEFFVYFGHFACVVLEVVVFGFVEEGLYAGFLE